MAALWPILPGMPGRAACAQSNAGPRVSWIPCRVCAKTKHAERLTFPELCQVLHCIRIAFSAAARSRLDRFRPQPLRRTADGYPPHLRLLVTYKPAKVHLKVWFLLSEWRRVVWCGACCDFNAQSAPSAPQLTRVCCRHRALSSRLALKADSVQCNIR